MQIVNAIDDAIHISSVCEELLCQLLEDISAVIDHVIARKSIKLHNGVRQFSAARYGSSSKDFNAIIFHHQPKLSAIPGQPLDYFTLIRRRFQVCRRKLIFNTRIEFHGEIWQMPEDIMEHIWL